MELGPKKTIPIMFWGPNSIMVVYVGPSGHSPMAVIDVLIGIVLPENVLNPTTNTSELPYTSTPQGWDTLEGSWGVQVGGQSLAVRASLRT